MAHLEDVSVEALQRALDRVDGPTATQRLIAAIAYKEGVTQTELAEWFDVERKTIYNWLTRLETDSLAEAATDERRSGRNRKLADHQLREFRQTVTDPPGKAGYDRQRWTAALVCRHIRETYDVEYSLSSCRRLLEEAARTG